MNRAGKFEKYARETLWNSLELSGVLCQMLKFCGSIYDMLNNSNNRHKLKFFCFQFQVTTHQRKWTGKTYSNICAGHSWLNWITKYFFALLTWSVTKWPVVAWPLDLAVTICLGSCCLVGASMISGSVWIKAPMISLIHILLLPAVVKASSSWVMADLVFLLFPTTIPRPTPTSWAHLAVMRRCSHA